MLLHLLSEKIALFLFDKNDKYPCAQTLSFTYFDAILP
jgi:hypothetical protein